MRTRFETTGGTGEPRGGVGEGLGGRTGGIAFALVRPLRLGDIYLSTQKICEKIIGLIETNSKNSTKTRTRGLEQLF